MHHSLENKYGHGKFGDGQTAYCYAPHWLWGRLQYVTQEIQKPSNSRILKLYVCL